MRLPLVRRCAYAIAAVIGTIYALYVVALKWSGSTSGGPLGDVGEFLLVLTAVVFFAIGLFVDEAYRGDPPSRPPATE